MLAIFPSLNNLWITLTSPPQRVDSSDYARAQLFLSLLVGLIPYGTLIVMFYGVTGQHPLRNFALGGTVILALIIVYFISRFYFRTVGIISVIGVITLMIYAGMLLEEKPSIAYAYLTSGIILSAMLLPIRFTVALTISNVFFVLSLPLLKDASTMRDTVEYLNFIILHAVLYIVIAVVRDRTFSDREAAIQQSQENEQKYRAVISQSTDCIFLMNPHTRIILEANEMLHRLLGYTSNEIIGMKLEDFVAHDLDSILTRIEQIIEQKHKKLGERFYRRRDGSLVPMDVSTYHIEYGTESAICVVSRDITERKNFENQLQYQAGLLENVSDAVISTDIEFNILSWNKAAERIYQWDAKDVIGRPLTDILSNEYVAETTPEEVLASFMQNGKWQGEVIQHSRNQQPIEILASVTLIKGADGKPSGAIAVNRDISSYKQAERLIVENEKMAVVQQVMSHLSHDLKTPLAVISTSIYLYENIDDQTQKNEEIQRVKNQVGHLNHIIQNILMLAKLDSDFEVAREQVDVNQLLNNIVLDLNGLAEHKNVVLSVKLDDKNPLMTVDSSMLRRALYNLIHNAINHTSSGGKIFAKTEFSEECAVLEVSDTGDGIPTDDLPFIFDRFYRADKARTREGSGLGLAITKSIVDKHDGSITASSTVGEGTIFTVKLPIVSRKIEMEE